MSSVRDRNRLLAQCIIPCNLFVSSGALSAAKTIKDVYFAHLPTLKHHTHIVAAKGCVSACADADTRTNLTPEIQRREAQISADPARRVAAGEAQIANVNPVEQGADETYR